jgi:hypothetical protein
MLAGGEEKSDSRSMICNNHELSLFDNRISSLVS